MQSRIWIIYTQSLLCFSNSSIILRNQHQSKQPINLLAKKKQYVHDHQVILLNTQVMELPAQAAVCNIPEQNPPHLKHLHMCNKTNQI